ncbi:MAG: DUF3999 family protein [Planctomycetes bacterium]|nr:DUF3999 family protein [Planctomycetota bacterium]
MNTRSLWVALTLLALAGSARADDPAFQFSKGVRTPALEKDDLVAIPLDSEVFAATQDSLADLRLLTEEGQSRAFLVRKRQTTRAQATQTAWPAGALSARPLDGGGLEITIHVDPDDKHPHPHGLQIISPLKNFEQRLRVYTSEDGTEWAQTGEDTVIFDYSRFLDVRSDRIRFPETAQRHFLIVIDDVTAEQQSELLALTRRLRGTEETERQEQVTIDRRPFRIDRIDFWREVTQDRATGDDKRDYPVSRFQVERDAKKQQTIILIDTQRQPLTSLSLETPARNFSRQATLEVEQTQGVKHTWQQIAAGTLSRIDFQKLQRETLTLAFPESRHERYRVVIDDRDSPPLEISGVKAEGNTYDLVFLAEPKQSYQLVYGSEDAEPAAHDTAFLRELLRERISPDPAELGPQTAWKSTGTASQSWKKLVNNPLLLGGVIALLAVALGWGLYRALQRVDQLPTGGPDA